MTGSTSRPQQTKTESSLSDAEAEKIEFIIHNLDREIPEIQIQLFCTEVGY